MALTIWGDVYKRQAVHYAIANIVPVHYGEVKAHKQQMADKIAKAVKERLTCEIQYWDLRAADLKEKEAAGKPNAKLNSINAQRRADDLQARMQRRLHELELEKQVCLPTRYPRPTTLPYRCNGHRKYTSSSCPPTST